MATATVALKTSNSLTSVPKDMTKESWVLFGTATLAAASTYITNGLALVWTGAVGTDGKSVLVESLQSTPYLAEFYSIGGGAGGYDYQWDSVHQTLRIFTGGVEVVTTAAIPAAVYADIIAFVAYFKKA